MDHIRSVGRRWSGDLPVGGVQAFVVDGQSLKKCGRRRLTRIAGAWSLRLRSWRRRKNLGAVKGCGRALYGAVGGLRLGNDDGASTAIGSNESRAGSRVAASVGVNREDLRFGREPGCIRRVGHIANVRRGRV